jgi:PAS domain S-box-containing protein
MGNTNKKKLLPATAEQSRHPDEQLLASNAFSSPRTFAEAERLVHELEVHQIELERQNVELNLALEELELSRRSYRELYDFAPVGYFTFDARGSIQAINLAGAELLGRERPLLLNTPFAAFIADTSGREIFANHIAGVLRDQGPEHCDLKLKGKEGALIHAHLQSVMQDSGAGKHGSVHSSITDNTVGARLRAEIQEAREYAENIVETVREPLVVLNSELKILTANHSFYETFKVTPEATIGNFIYDLADRQWDLPKLRVLIEEILPQDTVFNGYEVEHDFPGVGRKVIRLNGRQIFRGDIGSHLILLAMEDITEWKLAEEALRQAGALQRAIFNSANFSSIATDAQGVIQIFNVGAERMLGYTAAEVLNTITPAEISDPQEVIARAKTLSAELDTPITPGFEALVFKASRGIEDIYELTYIRKDGSRFPAVVSVTALRDEQEAIIGYLLIGTDNTARKQIEDEQKQLAQRLRDQQFYTRSLFEANIDALMTTDPCGIITDVNKQMEALTDCTRDELIGAPFKNCFTDPEQAQAGINLVLSEKKVTDYELAVRARDDRETVVSCNATTFYDRDRRLQGVFAAARDVTERKRLDQVLREKNVELEGARSVAEKANLAKSEFLSSMSHELRSPLNAILGFAQLMEKGSPLPTSKQQSSIDQILKAGWYLLKLINEILDLALIESGRLSLSLEPMSLADVLLECQAMIEPQAQQRLIRMRFPRLESPCFVHADQTRVKQVLINLLSNAIKYNCAQGLVEVRCGQTSPERIRISVQDTGAGLCSEKLAQLFQPFNRLGQETSPMEGTGIGLVVSKRLVELMGGEIGVESTVGVGTLFWIELQLAAAPQIAVDAAEALASTQVSALQGVATRTLLYVEDNRANMQLVEQLIELRADLRLLGAGDGTQGIALARIHQPAVILMDINLPGISGIQALKILRADPATAHIPVLAISANAMPHDIKKGLAAGFVRYLTKPININEFMGALDMALELADKHVVGDET